jgi:hypothetical protein
MRRGTRRGMRRGESDHEGRRRKVACSMPEGTGRLSLLSTRVASYPQPCGQGLVKNLICILFG